MIRVLIACEFSGVVRRAFRDRGHEAYSCDLLASEDRSPYHIQCNALTLREGVPSDYGCNDLVGMSAKGSTIPWDLLIAHPPCTFLANSGARWLYGGKGNVRDPVRWRQMEDAARFFCLLLDANIPKIAIENPIQHRHANLPRPDQIIQPWQFGHGEIKATCLWLKNLPKLKSTNIVDGRKPRVHFASPGPDRWKERSRTLAGIAAAMADQWGSMT